MDDQADFQWERTPLSETVADADNLDRFDAYRIYETLQYNHFSELTLQEKQAQIETMLKKLKRLKELPLGTETAKTLWLERLSYYIGFYEKLQTQMRRSSAVDV